MICACLFPPFSLPLNTKLFSTSSNTVGVDFHTKKVKQPVSPDMFSPGVRIDFTEKVKYLAVVLHPSQN